MRIRFVEAHPAFSDRSRKALQLANQEAHRLGHTALGVEHLLLGLAKDGQSDAATVLHGVGFDLTWLRGNVERLCPSSPGAGVLPGELPYSADLESFLENVAAAGNSCGTLPLTPEFLLAAVIANPDGLVRRILRRRRLSLWMLRHALRRLA